MNKWKCGICGQRLTDASGSWRMSFYDFGISHEPETRVFICSWCKGEIFDWLEKFSEKQKEIADK